MAEPTLVLCGADSSCSSGPGTRGARGPGRRLQFFRIQYVIDGDTVVLANGLHVRLVQIDTPELR